MGKISDIAHIFNFMQFSTVNPIRINEGYMREQCLLSVCTDWERLANGSATNTPPAIKISELIEQFYFLILCTGLAEIAERVGWAWNKWDGTNLPNKFHDYKMLNPTALKDIGSYYIGSNRS